MIEKWENCLIRFVWDNTKWPSAPPEILSLFPSSHVRNFITINDSCISGWSTYAILSLNSNHTTLETPRSDFNIVFLTQTTHSIAWRHIRTTIYYLWVHFWPGWEFTWYFIPFRFLEQMKWCVCSLCDLENYTKINLCCYVGQSKISDDKTQCKSIQYWMILTLLFCVWDKNILFIQIKHKENGGNETIKKTIA